MSVNSLSNFGPPGLNGDRTPPLQPIFANKYRVLFYNFGDQSLAPYDLTRQIQNISRPNTSFEVQTLYSYVSTVYLVNRGEHQTMTIRFLDDIYNTVTRRVENQKAAQQNFYDQTVSRAGQNYKFEMDLDVLAGGATAGGSASDPNIVQKWCYSGCMLTEINYGEMSYPEQGPMNIEVTVRYDNVVGFDQNGVRMGTYSHFGEIAGQVGSLSTGAGFFNSGLSVSNGSVGISVGGVSLGFSF